MHRELVVLVILCTLVAVGFVLTQAAAGANRARRLRDAAAWYEAGEQYLADGQTESAITALRRATAIDRDSRSYRLALAAGLAAGRQDDAARQVLLGVRESTPEDPEVNVRLARLEARHDDLTGAVRYYQAVTAADYDPFCVTAPTDPRLPGGGGNQICGLYDVKPAAFGRVSNLETQASNYGGQTEVYNGIDVTLNARFLNGAQVGGGVSAGRTVSDACALNALPQVRVSTLFGAAVSATAPQIPRTSEYCRTTRPWADSTQVKFLAIYPLPWDFQVSATYQNIPGIPITASRVFTNAEVRSSLGRDLGACRGAATCNATVLVDLVPNGTMFEDRLQQVDLRFTRAFRLARARIRGNADFYNLFNAGDVLNMTTRYAGTTGGQWLRPIQILGGRMFKFSAQLDF